MTTLLTIAQVSLESGIAKEVLRKWEERYGFPVPVREENSKRAYTQEQLIRLKLIKKLLNDGYRPAQVVPMEEPALRALHQNEQSNEVDKMDWHAATGIVEWLKARDPALLRERLSSELASLGLLAFVRDLMPQMNAHVGHAWQDGAIAVRDEHLYSEIVQGLIREALMSRIDPHGTPRILLTTAPGEAHALGLQMVEATMSLEGAYCISLGPQTPLNEIASAARELEADIVALSFSIAFPKKQILPFLRELRSQLPPNIKLWAGGGGTLGLEPRPRGVTLLPALPDAVECLKKHQTDTQPAIQSKPFQSGT